MKDQSFSARNFRIIYDLDRRNRGAIEINYFPKAYEVRKKINRLKGFFNWFSERHNNGLMGSVAFENKKNKIDQYIEIRKEQYNSIISETLNNISNNVNNKKYNIPLSMLPNEIKNKKVYSIGHDVEALFVSIQIKMTLRSLFSVKVNNRDLIVSRLGALANDKSPKYIIRADIKSFYESISHKLLLDYLYSSPELSVPPRRIVTQIIRKYHLLTGMNKGLPRGVGISAYLAELYMRVVDDKIRLLEDITYYERYVDDLIMVFSPGKMDNTSSYLPKIKEILNEVELDLNDKTKELNLVSNSNGCFEYLGYKFILTSTGCNISISSKKCSKIRGRVEASFEKYNQCVKKTPKKATKTILLKLKFLTGNARLYNSKSNAFVGIYFSNRFITDLSQLEDFDKFLAYKISTLKDHVLRKRLNKLSFKKGFKQIIFRKFSFNEFNEISRGWSDV